MDIDIQTAIVELLEAPTGKFTPSQIYRFLVDQPQYEGRVPSVRTIQRIVKDLTPEATPPALWHWKDHAAEDARIVLDVMDTLSDIDDDPVLGVGGTIKGMFRTHAEYHNLCQPTQRQADWIIRVAKVAPEMKPLMIAQVAVVYTLIDRLGYYSTDGLDMFLAMQPWRGVELAQRWAGAVNCRRIPPIPDVPGSRRLIEMLREDLGIQEPLITGDIE